ncbi:MAG TPA: tail sheath stabilizer and completion protein [Methanosarcina sp.]|nr:tail sheath stabilizer and completion protein [Methanosarcina sp.]
MASVVDFHYDGQIRRFIVQFIRMFSNFQVEFGKDDLGTRTLQTVPVYYGDASRQASQILKNNSESGLNAVPAMAAYISGLTYDRERLQNPYFESTVRVRDQSFNPSTQTYSGHQDALYTVDRMMPAPYKLTMKLDIWTSNLEQKQQLWEQIVPLFNPGFEIQSTDNYLDWTSLSVVTLTDTNYTSRTIPMGSDDTSIDIATFTFEIPIWLSLPAKVKKGGVVAKIIANIHEETGDLSGDIVQMASSFQIRYTPLNYSIVYEGNTLSLFKAVTASGTGVPMQWPNLVNLYGSLTNGISQVRLSFQYPDGEHEVVGTVAYNPSDPHQLIFSPDSHTFPANTLQPITAIIDPQNVPVNSDILTPAVGTRYLILKPIGAVGSESAVAWQGAPGTHLIANANDIIQWTGSYWHVDFDSQQDHNIEYVTNLKTGTQYYWYNNVWSKSVVGVYNSGEWSLVL